MTHRLIGDWTLVSDDVIAPDPTRSLPLGQAVGRLSRISVTSSRGASCRNAVMLTHRGGRIGVMLALFAVPACSGINAQTHSYATLAEARHAGAIEKGWVPEGLPAGTYELRVGYDPGTAQRWGIINFPPSQADALRGQIQPEELPLAGQRCDVPARIEWWPLLLRGAIDGERLASTGVRGYRARQGDLIFAINWNQGRGYYWSGR